MASLAGLLFTMMLRSALSLALPPNPFFICCIISVVMPPLSLGCACFFFCAVAVPKTSVEARTNVMYLKFIFYIVFIFRGAKIQIFPDTDTDT